MHEYDDGRDGDDRRRRDILNPIDGPTTTPSASSFSLRSPTQPEFHHQQPPPHFPTSTTAGSPSSAATSSSTSNGTRSLLHNPFLTGTTAPPSLPPPILPSAAAAPPRSPLHAPPVFYPQDMRDPAPPAREKTAGSFYDPTTDTTTTTKDRRLSDTGSSRYNNATQASSASKVSNQKGDAFHCFYFYFILMSLMI